MTLSEIDAFLHQKGNCNDTNTAKASWYPSLHYHIENGHFVCLADERFASTGSNYGDLIKDGETTQTAAEIIYEVSREYRINPQVLIVLLEKEQGLISDSWPNSIQYRSATGFGCPDTAPCDSEYYGLKNQLESAAWLFRTVLDGGWTNYPLGENYIYYNPNRACGGSVVNIENLATSSLYRYTPYQPNAAALAAGYGTATCGAYGNRNFYLFFMDYFGDPTIVGKQPISTDGYTSEEKDIVYQITKVYENNNNLGAAVSKLAYNKSTDIYWIEFKYGYIVGNPKKGFYVSKGDIRKVWAEHKFESGELGFPISNILSNPSTGIEWQQFENGYIVGNSSKGYYLSMGEIRKVWAKQTFELGSLGFPQSDIITEEGITYQLYEHDMIIYGDEKSGYHYVPKAIYDAWVKNGRYDSGLGKPTSNIRKNSASGAEWQDFENGAIVGNKTNGYYVSTGDIRKVWAKQNFEFGSLGFPKSDIITEENGVVYQLYNHDMVIASNGKNQYYYTNKAIYDIWSKYNFHKGNLGSSINNLASNPSTGIEWQQFENGYIVGNSSKGYYLSMGEIRKVWAKQTFELGSLGFPQSDIITEEGITYQLYEHDMIIYGDEKSGYHYVPKAIYDAWVKNGRYDSGLGKPTSNIRKNSASGAEWQDFENGAIVGNKTNGYYVSTGDIRKVWAKQNFEFGSLGFPKSDIITEENGTLKQIYQGGNIIYSKETGAYSKLN